MIREEGWREREEDGGGGRRRGSGVEEFRVGISGY